MLTTVPSSRTPNIHAFALCEDVPPSGGQGPATLNKSVQEHLGQELRGVYNSVSDKPTYLGESALPPKFDLQLNRLARRVVASERGSAAVAGAMQDSLSRTAVEAANVVQPPPTLQDWLRKTIAERPVAALLLGLVVGLCLGRMTNNALH